MGRRREPPTGLGLGCEWGGKPNRGWGAFLDFDPDDLSDRDPDDEEEPMDPVRTTMPPPTNNGAPASRAEQLLTLLDSLTPADLADYDRRIRAREIDLARMKKRRREIARLIGETKAGPAGTGRQRSPANADGLRGQALKAARAMADAGGSLKFDPLAKALGGNKWVTKVIAEFDWFKKGDGYGSGYLLTPAGEKALKEAKRAEDEGEGDDE